MPDTTLIAILVGALGLLLGAGVGGAWMRAAGLREREDNERLLKGEAAARQRELGEAQAELSRVRVERSALAARLQAAEQTAQDRKELLEGATERIRAAFAEQAAETLGKTSAQLSERHSDVLGALLGPMREQLEQFRKVLGETYARDHGERSSLRNELEALRRLNVQLGQEAGNLTRALKGDSRTQGAWGEMVLERVLEASGLERGRGYETQATLHDEHHARHRPDVIVHLPEGRDLVIDAKVALTAYERYCSATDEEQRELELADHVQALRRHVVVLAERGYAQLPGLRTLDFVLMFVPVEGAMSEAVRSEPDLYTYALTRHIAIVSPSTLLATLRTVSHLWRMEDRNANAAEIADKAGRMYDAFVKLAEDLRKVRTQMQRTQDLLGESLGRVEGGRGNLVSRSEELRRLGAKARKRLPPEVAERAIESDADSPEWDGEPEPIQPDMIGTADDEAV